MAPVYPQARAWKESGAYVIGVLGFRNRGLMFWEDKFRACCDELIVCTDDGSAGIKGLVTAGIAQAIEKHRDIDECVAIGPPIMMKGCADTTRPLSHAKRSHSRPWTIRYSSSIALDTASGPASPLGRSRMSTRNT